MLKLERSSAQPVLSRPLRHSPAAQPRRIQLENRIADFACPASQGRRRRNGADLPVAAGDSTPGRSREERFAAENGALRTAAWGSGEGARYSGSLTTVHSGKLSRKTRP